MSAEDEAMALAFTPFLAIEELNTILLADKPCFLRRNLSYSATASSNKPDPPATHVVTLNLSVISANASTASDTPYNPNFKASINVIVALCAQMSDLDGGVPEMVPLVAKIAALPVETAEASSHRPGEPTTVSLPISLPAGGLPKDTVVFIMDTCSSPLSQLTSFMLTARHRAVNAASPDARSLTCAVRSDSVFYFLEPGDRVFYSTLYPSDGMSQGLGTSQSGAVGLRIGEIQVHVDQEQHSQQPAANAVLPTFSVVDRLGPPSVSPPVLRYTLTVEPSSSSSSRRASPEDNTTSEQIDMTEAAEPRAQPPPDVQVGLTSRTGAYCLKWSAPGFVCPFDSCKMRCRDSFRALQQHLLASHHYYEFFFQEGAQGGSPTVWVRCKKEWFSPQGLFIPSLSSASALSPLHPFYDLLYRTARTLPFEYIRPRYECCRQIQPGEDPADALPVADPREAAREAKGAGPEESWIWDTIADPGPLPWDASSAADAGPSGSEASARRRAQGRGSRATAPRRPVVLTLLTEGGLPRFYHSRSCQAMTKVELESSHDSEDDTDEEEWERDCMVRLEEQPRLCPEERDFMLEWNRFVRHNAIRADFEVPRRCIEFAQAYAERLADASGPFRRCFAMHLHNFWQFRLLTPEQLRAALSANQDEERGGADDAAAAVAAVRLAEEADRAGGPDCEMEDVQIMD